MTEINDEVLMAYADGTLDAETRAAVEGHLAESPEDRDLVERMRRSAALLAEAFDAPMKEAPPQALIDTIMGEDSNVVSLGRRRAGSGVWREWGSLSVAASIALAVGIGIGSWALGPGGGLQGNTYLALGPIPTDSVLHQVLETRPSGDALMLGSGGQKMVTVLTFRDATGRPCREVEMLPAQLTDLPAEVGIACRDDGGTWNMEGAAEVAVDLVREGDTFKPVSGPDAETVEAVLDAIGAGQPLSPDEEARLLENAWR